MDFFIAEVILYKRCGKLPTIVRGLSPTLKSDLECAYSVHVCVCVCVCVRVCVCVLVWCVRVCVKTKRSTRVNHYTLMYVSCSELLNGP